MSKSIYPSIYLPSSSAFTHITLCHSSDWLSGNSIAKKLEAEEGVSGSQENTSHVLDPTILNQTQLSPAES